MKTQLSNRRHRTVKHLIGIGLVKSPPWVGVDWVLGQFGNRRYRAARDYRRFVREGLDRPSIRDGVQAQVLLGEQGLVEKFKGYVKCYEEAAEILEEARGI